jgi:hypothetical protein
MRKYLLAILILTFSVAAFAGTAERDSLYLTLEEDGAMQGWLSVNYGVDGDNVVYSSNGVINGTDKLSWRAVISKDLTMPKSLLFKGRMRSRNMEFDIKYNAGDSPDVKIMVDGTQYPGPDDKMPKRFILLPQMLPTGFAILSDYLSEKDPENYSGKFPASTMLGKMSLIIEGEGYNEVVIGSATVKVRSFGIVLSSKEMDEDVIGRLDQFEDGSFCGVRTDDGNKAYVVSAPDGGAEEAVNEVVFKVESSYGEMEGKLVLPDDASHENPAPIVIICNGPAQFDNDNFQIKEYIASELSTQGVATLMFDDRPDSVTMQTVIEDAVEMCRGICSVPSIASDKVMLLGCGLGTMALGEIAATVKSDSLSIDGLVGISGVWSDGSSFNEVKPQDASAFWFDSFLNYVPAVGSYENPVLLLHGALDQEVPSAESENFKNRLNESGNMRVSCNVVNGSNHYLQKSTTGAVEEYESLEPECIRGLVGRIASFVLNYTK